MVSKSELEFEMADGDEMELKRLARVLEGGTEKPPCTSFRSFGVTRAD